MKMYDGDFTFDETERVQVAINAYDAGENDGTSCVPLAKPITVRN
ncbi:hypothetical protein [Aeoliella mucimassa]|uniref:Uncharacterized protein n=1 Tax=Aeoliella mucimassa TaxID=2527972 RepID=A0A518AMK5_9BACT|nr:hypothetical protein [Aeoliella mucimassa]QDU55936.1 hypothetical protein Pan181_21380 [Aeoliella mucimassa]